MQANLLESKIVGITYLSSIVLVLLSVYITISFLSQIPTPK